MFNCIHEARTSTVIDGIAFYECDECGDLQRMTAVEFDWFRPDMDKCSICWHSEDFGGPLALAPSVFGNTYLTHITCWEGRHAA